MHEHSANVRMCMKSASKRRDNGGDRKVWVVVRMFRLVDCEQKAAGFCIA